MTRNIYKNTPAFELGIIQSRAARNLLEFREGILHEFGLGSPEWFVLGYVTSKTDKGGTKVGDIAAELDVQSTYVTGVLRRLEAKDLVSSRPGNADRRVRMVTATKHGISLNQTIENEYIKQSDELLGKVPADALNAYLTVLKRLADV